MTAEVLELLKMALDRRAFYGECPNLDTMMRAQESEKAIVSAIFSICSDEHCRDCCCARSWEALGVTTNTGKSIVEHIEELCAERDSLRAENAKMKAAIEAQYGIKPPA